MQDGVKSGQQLALTTVSQRAALHGLCAELVHEREHMHGQVCGKERRHLQVVNPQSRNDNTTQPNTTTTDKAPK